MNNIKNGQSAAKQVLVKPIKGWEDKYLAYSDGRIYSLLRNKFLKPRMSMDGYERVCLFNDGKRYEYRVHRLIAETFIDNTDDLPQVNHKDFNRSNNCLDNLEWCTNYENIHYSINVYNGKHFTIIGIRQVAKQFKCSVKNVYAILAKYQNTGAYVVNGFFKGLRVDSEYLKVQRLADYGVASSEAKCETSSNG